MKSSPLSEVVSVEGEVDAVEDCVVAGSEVQLAIALSGVLVDGKVPLLELAAVAQAAERRSRVVDVAEASPDGGFQPGILERTQLREQVLQRLVGNGARCLVGWLLRG